MERQKYPSDLTDDQWDLIKDLIPRGSRGPERQIDEREVVNAVLYINRTGCQWRYLPQGFPPWHRVSHHYHSWRKKGVWENLNGHLTREVRKQAGREASPSAGIIDSQSVKTSQKGGLKATTRVRRSTGANVT